MLHLESRNDYSLTLPLAFPGLSAWKGKADMKREVAKKILVNIYIYFTSLKIEIFISDNAKPNPQNRHSQRQTAKVAKYLSTVSFIMAGVNNNLQFETSKEVTVYVP